MTGRERKLAETNAKRLKSTIRRVEQQPYDTRTPARKPRLGGYPGHLLCHLTATLPAASGGWPNPTPGIVTNQQLYTPSYDGTNYSLVPFGAADATILNYSSGSFAVGKTTDVVSSVANTYRVLVQDC